MKVGERHSAVLIGASTALDALRRELAQSGCGSISAVGSLTGVRRLLTAGGTDATTVIVMLDEVTRERFGLELPRLIDAMHDFPGDVRCIGLLTDTPSLRWAAEFGCDWYAHCASQASWIVGLMIDPQFSDLRRRSESTTRRLQRRPSSFHECVDDSMLTCETMNRIQALESVMEKLFRHGRDN